jgi:UDP:flavonoid glycosyltransferase YjiC (YdhE family)
MRILFSGNPVVSHLLPMMPLADVGRAAGHETALLTSGDLASLVAPVRVLQAGPSVEEMIDESFRRTGSHPSQPVPETMELFAGVRVEFSVADVLRAVELYAGLRVELSYDEALAQTGAFGPDLVVCEQYDFVGPMVAAALGVPWAAHAVMGPLPEPFWLAMRERVAGEYRSRSLTATPRIALVDPYPDALRSPAEQPPADRITIHPAVNEHGPAQQAEPDLPSGHPCALVTLGTTVNDSVVLSALASSVAAAGFTAVVTAQREDLSADIDEDRVRPVGFVPLARLLPQADLVVTAGGTGTVLASLSRGLPMVIRPFLADQPWNAARLAYRGAAIVIGDAAEAGAAARRIAENPAYSEAAKSVAAELASLNSPDTVLRQLIVAAATAQGSGRSSKPRPAGNGEILLPKFGPVGADNSVTAADLVSCAWPGEAGPALPAPEDPSPAAG